ncbi:hypothetical protein [Bacillus sp. T33-2]|uniref:hypothetical protein n=1 Tax=Bacillus sp. T33-2 TaxID=2054168 RepID=UPI000C7908A4|nr:hypothetical protein [Bacillus sp. T33-2]PLR99924.1 hypothetical protein CVD19_02405 [Bacillus sp. T33-2]
MLRRNEGFFLAEMLLSLSAWILSAAFMLPMAMLVVGQSSQMKQEANAVQLMYENLQEISIGDESGDGNVVSKDGTQFKITYLRNSMGLAEEVCVQFEGYSKKPVRKCGFVDSGRIYSP